ncbi:hypothetical protein BJV82DRAFT_626604 [Fennellomyces sp. T-0311]|nr:hypothetical protein BJV82DRAFT_626604 [Fennellomyces sp. T-0311]
MSRGLMSDVTTIVTALLSTSCCVVQLLLNAFSFSCAGFAIFTPYRGYLTAATMVLLALKFGLGGWKSRRAWTTASLVLAIMMTPELVAWVNVQEAGPSQPAITSVMIQLDGLGCLACANRIRNALLGVDWVESASVFFDNSSALIQYRSGQAGAVARLVQVVKDVDAKYDAFLIV